MKITEELLHRYHDGELSPPDTQHVAEAVDKDPMLQKQLAQLRCLTALLHTHAAQHAERAAFAGVYEDIRRAIAPKHAWWERLRVSLPERRGFWMGWALPVGATALVAAVVLLVWLPSVRHADVPTQRIAQVPEADSARPRVAGPSRESSEFVEMDLGENSGTVIDIEPEAGEHVAILWVEEPE